jgi:hypothetical protein
MNLSRNEYFGREAGVYVGLCPDKREASLSSPLRYANSITQSTRRYHVILSERAALKEMELAECDSRMLLLRRFDYSFLEQPHEDVLLSVRDLFVRKSCFGYGDFLVWTNARHLCPMDPLLMIS